MNTKRKGSTAEREIMKLMRDWDYDATHSAASLGCADVVAWNNEKIRFIQCKSEAKKPGSYTSDIEKLKRMKCPPNGTRELWIRKPGRTWNRMIIMNDGTVTHDVLNG